MFNLESYELIIILRQVSKSFRYEVFEIILDKYPVFRTFSNFLHFMRFARNYAFNEHLIALAKCKYRDWDKIGKGYIFITKTPCLRLNTIARRNELVHGTVIMGRNKETLVYDKINDSYDVIEYNDEYFAAGNHKYIPLKWRNNPGVIFRLLDRFDHPCAFIPIASGADEMEPWINAIIDMSVNKKPWSIIEDPKKGRFAILNTMSLIDIQQRMYDKSMRKFINTCNETGFMYLAHISCIDTICHRSGLVSYKHFVFHEEYDKKLHELNKMHNIPYVNMLDMPLMY